MCALCLASVTPIFSAVLAARIVAQVVRDHDKADTASELHEKGLNEDGRTQRRATDGEVADVLKQIKDLHARLDTQDTLMEDKREVLEETVNGWKHQDAGSKRDEAMLYNQHFSTHSHLNLTRSASELHQILVVSSKFV